MFLIGGERVGLRHVAVRFEDGAERAEVAEHIAFTITKRFARDADAGLVDGAQFVRVAVSFQHRGAAAKCVRDDAIRSGVCVTSLDFQHTFGLRQIPVLAATALFEAGEHELRAHRAVANEPALAHGFVKKFFHGLVSEKMSLSKSACGEAG